VSQKPKKTNEINFGMVIDSSIDYAIKYFLSCWFFPFKRRVKQIKYKIVKAILKPWEVRRQREEAYQNAGKIIHYELNEHRRQRESHEKDLIQPFNSDGTLNRDFKKVYPNSEFVKRYRAK